MHKLKKMWPSVFCFCLIVGLAVPAAEAAIIAGSAVGSFSNVITLQGAGAGWSNIANNDATDVAIFSWGKPTGQSSTFTFDGNGSNIGSPLGSTTLDNLFSLGTYTYYNSVTRQDKIYGVDFGVNMNIAGYGPASLLFHLLITDTPDNSNPVASADIVSIANMAEAAKPFMFTVSGQRYNFQLMGFSRDGGKTFETQAVSLENTSTTAQIYGKISAVSAVPVPAAVWLLGSGLLGLLGCVRRGSVEN